MIFHIIIFFSLCCIKRNIISGFFYFFFASSLSSSLLLIHFFTFFRQYIYIHTHPKSTLQNKKLKKTKAIVLFYFNMCVRRTMVIINIMYIHTQYQIGNSTHTHTPYTPNTGHSTLTSVICLNLAHLSTIANSKLLPKITNSY